MSRSLALRPWSQGGAAFVVDGGIYRHDVAFFRAHFVVKGREAVLAARVIGGLRRRAAA